MTEDKKCPKSPTKEQIELVKRQCQEWIAKFSRLDPQELLSAHGALISVMLERRELTTDQALMIGEVLNARPLGAPEEKPN